MLHAYLRVPFPQILTRFILKTSGHACVHIVNLSGPPQKSTTLQQW